MSINNVNEYNSIGNQIYGEYKFSDSSFVNTNTNREYEKIIQRQTGTSGTSSYKETYSVPLDFVKNQCYSALVAIKDEIRDIENSLKKVYINPSSNYELLLAHQDLWQEVSKNITINNSYLIEYYKSKTEKNSYSNNQQNPENPDVNSISLTSVLQQEIVEEPLQSEIDQILDELDAKEVLSNDIIITAPDAQAGYDPGIQKIPTPSHISFEQLVYAERSATTVSRKFLEEFYEIISHSTFSYIYQIRKILNYFYDEIINIQKSLQTDYGDAYENELQQKVAVHYDAHSKTAVHYAKRIAKIFISAPEQIPATELDQVTKEQASKFQAFFAIKLNAVNSQIEDVLGSLKRDLHDNSDIFYDRYLRPALKFSSRISNPLELDFQTTAFGKKIPFLSEELVTAAVAMKGNFTSVLADYVDRHNIIIGKMDALLQLIHEKRKYANFINQLAITGVEKPRILMTVSEDYYSNIFATIGQYISVKNKITSDHGLLSGLEEDHHPQYLLKDGGTITGDISVQAGVKIDGLDLDTHAHTGTDGSAKISSLDIDYGQARNQQNIALSVKEPLNIAVSKFNVDIVNKLPVCSAVINIEVDDDTVDGYEYEIIYKEIE